MNMAGTYYNFKKGLASKPSLLTLEEISAFPTNENEDFYVSIYKYNKEHKNQAELTGSVAGIKDVTTDVLVWDFDSVDVEKARLDTVALAHRLVDKYKVSPDQIRCYWSGNKGYHLILPLGKDVSPEQFKQATSLLAEGLETFDTTVSDPQRILRLEYTKHPKSGLFKIPLHISDIEEMNSEAIMEKAITSEGIFDNFDMNPVSLPDSLFTIKEKKKLESPTDLKDFDYSNPPKGWKPYKWAIAQGWFDSGERHNALMVLAATCRGLGYPRDLTYYTCKNALKQQAKRTGEAEFDKTELYNNIIKESVFSDRWEGGQYSPDTNPWLKRYCERMGFDTSDRKDKPVVDLDSLITQFIDYSTNFEQNIIRTGIKEIDDNVILSTSTLNGLLGQPGSGKTTIAVEILKNASMNGVPSMFFSLDMGPPLIFSKLVQKESGVNFKDALKMYREDKEQREKISKLIKAKYKNIGFNFRCGITVADLKLTILEQIETTGIKPKLVVVDYLENIAGPFENATANIGMITNQLKDLATEMEVCVLLLLQTQKHSTPDISDPLLSMKQIKGSSAIEQNCSTVLTLWREGYNPNYIHYDNYISFALVKSRFGPLWKGDFHWEPIKGTVSSLTEEQRVDFDEFKKRKSEQRAADSQERRTWQ